jgi:hypothetical protein
MTMKVICHDGECHYANKKLGSDCKDCDILEKVEFDLNRYDTDTELN